MYGTYHMTNPTTFYNREDRWEVPHELYGASEVEVQPYYVMAQLPGAPAPLVIASNRELFVDRYLLDRVSTLVLGLDGHGGAERFADYSQWDVWQEQRKQKPKNATEARPPSSAPSTPGTSSAKEKPSYLDAREYQSIEQRVHEAEHALEQKRSALQDPSIAKDGRLLEQ